MATAGYKFADITEKIIGCSMRVHQKNAQWLPGAYLSPVFMHRA